MNLSVQGGEGNTILLTDMKAEEVKVAPVDGLAEVNGLQVTTASTYCPLCGTWAPDLAEAALHKESMKHKRNRLFHVYQVSNHLSSGQSYSCPTIITLSA